MTNAAHQRDKAYIVTGVACLAFLFPWIGFLVPRSAALIVPLFAVLLLLGTGWEKRSLQDYRSPVWIGFLIFLGLALLSLLWSLNSEGAGERIEKLVLFLPIGLSLAIRLNGMGLQSSVKNVEWALVAGAGIALAALWFHMVTDGGVFALLNPDYTSVEKAVSVNRPSAILLLSLTAVFLSLNSVFNRSAALLFVVVLMVSLPFTTSQTASIGILLWALTWALAQMSARFAGWAVLVGGCVLIFTMPALVLVVEMFDVERTFDYGAGSVGARLDIWYAVTHKILQSPLWGFGLEASRVVADWAFEFKYVSGINIPHPHNGILQVWLEFGVIGAGLAAAAWVALVRGVRHFSPQTRPALYAGLIAFLFILSVSHGLWQSWWVNAVFGAAALTILVARRAGSGAEGASANQV